MPLSAAAVESPLSCPLCGHTFHAYQHDAEACAPCPLPRAARACAVGIICPRCGYVCVRRSPMRVALHRAACAARRWLSMARAVAVVVAVFFAFATAGAEEVSRARYLMGTTCTGRVPLSQDAGDDARARAAAALEAAFEEIARLESILSDWRGDSELSRLNREAAGAPFACSQELFDFIALGDRLSRRTEGAFDLTVAPLVRLYDIRGAGRWPGRDELAETRGRVGFSRLQLDARGRTVRFTADGMGLDPGALGKGFALDAAARVLRERGIRSALLDFGGQVMAVGAPPGRDAWEVAIAHPLRRGEPAMTVQLRDTSASTSGNAERGLIVDGRDLGHIIDPVIGRPIRWRGSATAIAAAGAEADALSTALMVMGQDRGLSWAARHEGLTAIFLDATEDGGLTVGSASGPHAQDAAPRRGGVSSTNSSTSRRM